MSLLEETKLLLRTYRIEPKKSLGQNFTVEPQIFKQLVDHASLNCNDTVLEVGSGLGFFTRFLSKKCKDVFAVEADSKLVNLLRERLRDLPNVRIFEGDILNVALPPFNKIVSIPPYQISSKLLLWILKREFKCAVMVFQREFAQKLVAPVGTRNYGWLTVFAYHFSHIELLNEIPKSMFYPEPKIDSVIMRVTPKEKQPFMSENEKSIERFLRILFTRRNRTVRNAVLAYLKQTPTTSKEDVMKPVNSMILGVKRVRQLEPKDFGELASAIIK